MEPPGPQCPLREASFFVAAMESSHDQGPQGSTSVAYAELESSGSARTATKSQQSVLSEVAQ